MGFDTTLYLTMLITLAVIMDPPGQVPLFGVPGRSPAGCCP
jgi:multiple antibiotic resistance protein